MAEKETHAEVFPGMITKAAQLEKQEVTDDELKLINKHTLSPLSAEEVFTFKATLCDNEVDRQSERFTVKALEDLKKLFIGKTVIKDHSWSANDQVARIYATDLVMSEKTNKSGEPGAQLVAYCYMVKTASNADLIAEIKGGIKKEVSTSCTPEKMVCNICNGDGRKCIHWPGVEYTIQDGTPTGTKKRCKLLIDGAKDAYELSFVAVPAQPRAGTHKSIGFAKLIEDKETPETNPENGTKNTETDTHNEKMDARIFAQRVRNAESFFNANKEREDK